MANEQTVTLYLAPWQKRMVKDFVSSSVIKSKDFARINKVMIVMKKGGCLASYKLPATGMRIDDWLLYLTDEQMNIMSEALGLRTPISSVNISGADITSGVISFR
jgi:hypothetical protein